MLVGMGTFATGAVVGNPWVVLAATLAPFPFAALWGRQYGAGVVASYTAPWVLPPTLVAAIGYGVYAALERLASALSSAPSERGPMPYEKF